MSVYSVCFSQDTLKRANGERVLTKVLAVKEYEVDYTLYSNQQGPVHTLLKSDIAEIAYANGTKDVFDVRSDAASSDDYSALSAMGTADAKKYYKASGPEIGGAVSAIYPFYGAISALIIASSRPSYDRLNYPDQALMNKPAYRQAYEHKAFRIKKAKTWTGFGIGTGVVATIVGAVLIASLSANGR